MPGLQKPLTADIISWRLDQENMATPDDFKDGVAVDGVRLWGGQSGSKIK